MLRCKAKEREVGQLGEGLRGMDGEGDASPQQRRLQ